VGEDGLPRLQIAARWDVGSNSELGSSGLEAVF